MSPLIRLLLIFALVGMWSPSYLFIKLAVQDFSPFTIVALRVSIGAIVLFLIMKFTKRSLPRSFNFWVNSTMMAILSSGLPFYLFCYAEQTIDSALAAILNGASPMFTALTAHFFLSTDRITPQKLLGVAISFLGLLLFFAPNIINGIEGTLSGMIAALFGTIIYSLSHVYAKKFTTGHPPFVAPTAQLLMTAVMMIPLALIFEDPLNMATASTSSLVGVAGLSLFGTILAFIIYYRLMEHCGATAISMVACFFPVGGMLLGFFFLGELFSIGSLIAAGFILLGMLLVNEIIVIKRFKPLIAP